VPENELLGHENDRDPSFSNQFTSHRYRILQKGSRYNISGPNGRIFSKYKSAGVAGPRWEELTLTPWPHQSSAYQSGLRLWELGVIERDQVGQRQITVDPRPARAKTPGPKSLVPVVSRHQPTRSPSLLKIEPIMPPLALPRPRIDLEKQASLMHALRRDPNLLFNANIREALYHEVEYHLPYARWAKTLLRMLERYEKRRRVHQPAVQTSSQTILAKHIAWQEQRVASIGKTQ
jgi:hypothetical protein